LLTEYFLSRYSKELAIDNPGIAEEAMPALISYQWPGNVRELANTLQKSLIFNRGAPISPDDISQAVSGKTKGAGTNLEGDQVIRQWAREMLNSKLEQNLFDVCVDRFASIFISEALNLTGGNRSRAAKLLGLSRPTLHSKIEKYRLKFETSVLED
jgi:DNA-binding NtrC family response regulator